MLTTMEANSLVRGLIFVVQKTRSDLTEGLGSDDLSQELLADMHPWLFGPRAVLPQLLAWQARCDKAGIIGGGDLFNFVKLIDMSDSRVTLALLPIYGYTEVPIEGPPIEWFSMTWPYLTDGF